MVSLNCRCLFLAAALALLALSPLASAAEAPSPAGCKSFPALRVPEGVSLKIDGALDEWAEAASFWLDPRPAKEDNTVGACKGPADLSAEVMVLWDEQAVYVAATVRDDHVRMTETAPDMYWANDGLEVFLDLDWEGDAGKAEMDADDLQVILCPFSLTNRTPDAWSSPQDYKGPVQVKACRTKDGYLIEAAMPVPDAYRAKLKAGGALGFNVAVNDADPALVNWGAPAWKSQFLWRRGPKPSETATTRNKLALVATAAERDAAGFWPGRFAFGTLRENARADSPTPVILSAGRLPAEAAAEVLVTDAAGNKRSLASGVKLEGLKEIPLALSAEPGRVQVIVEASAKGEKVFSAQWPMIVEKVIDDFPAVLPAGLTSEQADWDKWLAIPWTSSGGSGRLLWSYWEAKPPRLAIPLDVKGWYAVSLGFWCPGWVSNKGEEQGILAGRLTGEEGWETFRFHGAVPSSHSRDFEEQFWRLADLTGRNLEIEWKRGSIGLAYIRLIPLTPAQAEKVHNSPRLPWLWTQDGFGMFDSRTEPPEKIVFDQLDPFAGTDFTDVSWCIVGADLANYPTKLGTLLGANGLPLARPCDRHIADNIKRLIATGGDTLALAVGRAREKNLNICLSMRPQAWILEQPFESAFGSAFYYAHPEWVCRSADGGQMGQMSFAFPGVREHLIGMFLEMAARKPPALHLIFNRGFPCSQFEAPALEEFRKRHGEDLRKLPELDPRVVELRAGYVTTFLRELRTALDAQGHKEMKIFANTFQTESLNKQLGMDVAGWAKEGLVARLMPFQWEARAKTVPDMKYYLKAVAGTACEVWPFAYNGNLHANDLFQDHRARAWALYSAGARGLCGWDANPNLTRMDLGRPGALEVWAEVTRPLPPDPIRTLGALAMDAPYLPGGGF